MFSYYAFSNWGTCNNISERIFMFPHLTRHLHTFWWSQGIITRYNVCLYEAWPGPTQHSWPNKKYLPRCGFLWRLRTLQLWIERFFLNIRYYTLYLCVLSEYALFICVLLEYELFVCCKNSANIRVYSHLSHWET